MSPKKILILTASHLCRNPRVVKEATTLGAAGYNVTVMSVSASEHFEKMDREMMNGLPFQRRVIDYTAPTLRAHTSSFVQRGTTWGARLLCRKLGLETAQSLGPASALLRFARSHPADLTIAHTEIPIWAAQYLIRDGRRVAVDIEDWYSEDLMPEDRRSRPLRLLRASERFALNHAVYSSTTSSSMVSGLTNAYGCPPPVVLRNTFPLQERSRIDRAAGVTLPAFAWFSQTIGPGRGLEQFFAAWALTRIPSRVFLIGDLRPDYGAKLLANISPASRTQVQFLPLIAPGELPGKLAGFDLGLALEPRTPRNKDLTISNKVFQYLSAGLALVATDTAGQSEVMQAVPTCGLLIRSDTPVRLAARLDELLGNPTRLRACQLAARSAAERDYCWEKEAPKLLDAVARALATPCPAT